MLFHVQSSPFFLLQHLVHLHLLGFRSQLWNRVDLDPLTRLERVRASGCLRSVEGRGGKRAEGCKYIAVLIPAELQRGGRAAPSDGNEQHNYRTTLVCSTPVGTGCRINPPPSTRRSQSKPSGSGGVSLPNSLLWIFPGLNVMQVPVSSHTANCQNHGLF